MTKDLQSAAVHQIFRFGEFTFDCASRRLLCGGTERHLSPKALRLLGLLLQAQPRALSRQELYDALWPETYVSETNLAGIVNELRRVLVDHARASQFVRTVHGFGYAFCGEASSSQPNSGIAAMLLWDGCTSALMDGENIIGRALDARVVINNSNVSRRHARILINGGEIWIEDLGSKNGTYVDGRRIVCTRLCLGQRIELGGVSLILLPGTRSSTKTFKINGAAVKRRSEEQPRP